MTEPAYDAILLVGGSGAEAGASGVSAACRQPPVVGQTGMSAPRRRRELAIAAVERGWSHLRAGMEWNSRMRASALRGRVHGQGLRRRFRQAAGLCLLLALTACRTPAPLPPADTTQPGWRVLNGQAIWLARRGGKEVAGELLIALGLRQDSLVQFSKTPFPLVTTRVAQGAWQIEFGAGARRYGGRGQPPVRFVWFALADALRGDPVAPPWRAEQPAPDRWRLANAHTGERLEVWLSP